MMKYTRWIKYLLLVVFLSACSGLAASDAIPAVEPRQTIPLPADLRDYRYCEIIPVFQSGLTLNISVYNTLGRNQCPADLWAGMDADALAKMYGARLVKLNGPRYWVMNKIIGQAGSLTGKTADFGGMEMTLRATLQTCILQGTIGDRFYTPNAVHRTTVFEYWAGNQVYELVGPGGDTYIMQSYSQIADPTLTIDSLPSLGDRLKLPEGWKYQVRVLQEDISLPANGTAIVINDELYNSYQKIMP